ncbi:MAG: discoidin domain-containing protein [Arenicella sp.]
MKEKMTSKFCLHIAVLLFCLFCIVSTQAQNLDFYEETGLNPFQTQDSIVPNESVDPFSGIVQLSNADIVIPGNGGLDIVINRSYTSSRRSLLNLPGEALGAGWKFHFGRISGRDLTVCLEDNDFDEYTTNNVSVEMNSGSQDLLVRSSIAGVEGLISKNNLRAKCSDDPFSVVDNVIITPDGTRYEHKIIGAYSRVYRIEDVHGNWIRIEYDSQGLPLEIYRKEESEESTANGGSEQPVLTFQYKTELVTKKYLESITYGEKIWQYSVELFDHPNGASDFYLTQVTRPDGKTWKYAYFPNDYVGFPDPSNPDLDPYLNASPGAASIQKITYPDGGEVDYTYQAVGFTQNLDNIKHHVIESKTVTDPITNSSATWTYQFAPRSDETYPGTDKVTDETGTYVLNERLALDVTTVRSPYGTEVYRHIGNHVSTYDVPTSPVNNDKKFAFFEQALVGNLIRKEVYGTDNILIEARTYNWGLREISDEKYTRAFFSFNLVATRISDDQTSAPLLLSEHVSYDLQWNGTNYGLTSYEAYDEFGNPTRIRESGNTSGKADTIIEYEYANNLEKWIIGLPTKKTIKFEGAGDVATTISDYDLETGNLTQITDLGITTEYTYHSNGELATVKDANGVITQYDSYSRGVTTAQKNGLKTSTGSPSSHILPVATENNVTRVVNPSGTIASIINPNGNETRYSYDLFDRITAIDFPLNADVTVNYSNANAGGDANCSTCATRTITRGVYKRIDYLDGFGRVIITLKGNDSVNKILKTRYDLLGRVIFESLPSSEDGISYEYDALNRQTKRTNSDGTFSTMAYTQNVAIRSTDELGNTIDRLYDDIGSTLQYGDITQELRNGDDGVGTKYTRDVLGNVVELFHGDFKNGGLSGFTRFYEYNDKFQLIKEDNFETPDKEYSYDDAGYMTSSSSTGSNITNSYVYDSLYRLKTIESSNATPDLSYEYDANSNAVKTINGIVEKTYEYDVNDNLIREQLDIGSPYNESFSHRYTYNDRDVVSSLEYPSGLVTDFAPDVLGRQKKAGIFASNVEYFPSSHLKSYTLGNNKVVEIDLDKRLFVKNISVNNLVDLSYSYDSVGNVRSINDALDSARNVSIPIDGYDAVYRLRKATGPWGELEYDYSDGRPMDFKTRTLNGQVETYLYDAASNGNLSEFFPAGSTQVSDVSYRYSYDKLGNISQRKKRVFSFPLFSEFTLEETNFQYDANSRLLRAGDKQYLYDAGGMQVAEIGARARDRKFNFYNQAETLVFEYDRSKCMTTDYIRIESTQIAKSDDTDEQDTDGDQLSDCHEKNIGNAINDPSDGAVDTDGDGVEDREEINVLKTDPYEIDTDGDGANDNVDVFPNDPTRTGLESDVDGDGVPDVLDTFPNDPTESKDTDSDGVGDNADAFPNDPTETTDSDGDGVGDNADAFPNDANETVDTDGDGVGDNADAFPNNQSETRDSDNDGVGNNADAFPFDPNETTDTDADGVGDNADSFPNDPNESADTDNDGVGNNADAFPNDPTETVDSDGDGVGDNSDAFPNDPTQSVDENGNGIGDFLDSDHDGLYDEVELILGTDLQSDGGEALADYDNDGFSNRQEAIAGTDLNDASAVPELGELLWTRKIRLTDKKDISEVQGMALGNKGYLYTGSGDILSRSGSVKARTSVPLASSPSIAQDGLAYYGNGCSLVSVNEEGDQTEFANYPVPANVSLRGGCIFSGPSMNSDASLFVVSTSNQYEPNFPSFITFDENGSLLTPLSPSVFWISDHLIGPDNTIYTIPTDDYSFTSFNASGTLNWTAGAAQTNTFSIDRDGFLFFSDGAEIKKINTEDGSTVFSHPYQDFGGSNVRNGNKNLLIGDDDTLYFTASNDVDILGYLNAKLAKLDTQTGAAEVLDCDIDQLGFIGKNGSIYGFVTERIGNSVALKACDASGSEVWQAPLSSAYSFGLLDIGIQTSNSYAIDEDGTLYLSSVETDPATSEAIIVVSAFITDSQGLADTPWPKFRHDNQNTGHQPGEQLVLPQPAQILSPAEGETLQSDVLTLRWEDVQADSYLIQVGSQSGLSDITEMTVSGSQTEAVLNLPGDNSLIYVRLISQFDDQSLYDEISLYALGSSNLVNLAEGKPANQSSTYAAGSASRAVDDNTSGVWTEGSVTHTSNADQSWWQVDLGVHSSIDSISLHNRTDCCADRLSNFYVLVSDTPFGSRSLSELLADSTVYNSFHEGLNETSLDIVLGNVTGRYVRVQLQDAGVLSLAEVQVFGNVLADQPSAAAQILSPLEGEKLQSGVVTLKWEDVQADNYLIQIGTQRGLSDIAEVSVAGSQTQAVVDIARSHSLFYVRLVSQFGSQSSYDEIFLGLASLAQGKPAEQSSTYAAGAANRAVDGNTNGVWAQGSVTHTNNSTQPWWQVDLESNASIESVIVHNRTDCCADRLSNFYVLVSDTPFGDRSLDELLSDVSIESRFHAGTLNGMNVSIPFAGAIGRYVRVQLQGNGPLSLAEVEVIGTPVATTPVGDGLTQENPATSCKAILDASPLAMTGVYWLLRNDGLSAFQAYCDMTTDGGGWTMVVAQYETSRTNDWNQGIQAAYNPTLTTKQGFVFNSNEIPAHTQTGFGQDLKPTDIDYVDFQYSTGDIPLTGLTGLKTGNLYYIYRNRLNSYGSGDPRPDGNLITIPQWNDALMFDVHPGLYTWGFAPNNPERLNRLSGASYGGVRRTQSNDDFAWTIWVR